MRHELEGKAATRLDYAIPPLLALLAAVVLLVVSPGKRFELWAAAIVGGLVVGAAAGAMQKVNQDHGRGGPASAAGCGPVRELHPDGTQSSGFGVLAGGATFLAAYVAQPVHRRAPLQGPAIK